MAFTRFHDDPCRIMKHLQESTDVGLYYLNAPGNGAAPAFVSDPHVRLQAWGANRHDQLVTVESELRGIGIPLSKDMKAAQPKARPITYATDDSEVTAVPRSCMPAWELRGTESYRWEPLLNDPQAPFLVTPFPRNAWTHKPKEQRSA
jgi:hypothetical protein